jgi:hypothetical protein
MIKWFKNLLLVFLLVLSFNEVKSQNSIILGPSTYNKWVLSNSTCSGCGSFYIMVTNQLYPANDGYYYYDIYLWSNSFYTNGYAASSYVKNIKISILQPNGTYYQVLTLDYALVPPKSMCFNGYFHLAYVYSFSAKQTIKLTWSDTEVW